MQTRLKQVLEGKKKSAVITGDCGYVLLTMPDACVDAAIIDPPGALNFCNKDWDGKMGGRESWVKEHSCLFRSHARVVKPGRFVFIWSFPRTTHWTGSAIEDSGLEIVDCFYHLFSHRKPSSPHLLKVGCEMWWLCRVPESGFPIRLGDAGRCWGSHLVPALRAAPGTVLSEPIPMMPGLHTVWLNGGFRVKVVSVTPHSTYFRFLSGPNKGAEDVWPTEMFMSNFTPKDGSKAPKSGNPPRRRGIEVGSQWICEDEIQVVYAEITSVIGDLIHFRMNGAATCLRRDTFLDYFMPIKTPKPGSKVELGISSCLIPAVQRPGTGAKPSKGRHPTNVCLTHSEAAGEVCTAGCVVDTLNKMSGQLRSGVGAKVSKSVPGYKGNAYGTHTRPHGTPCVCYGDQGGASRFFSVLHNDVPFLYCNRASKKERNAGLPEGMTNEGVAVKPLELMVKLVKLANVPPGGIVLDGFAGTGSTGCACAKLGVRFIGIEKNPVDAEVARRRISHQEREK